MKRNSAFGWRVSIGVEVTRPRPPALSAIMGCVDCYCRESFAIVDPESLASLRVNKKIGMTFEREVTFQGYTHPDHLYAIANE
jgi:hypothetical protein